LSSKYIVEYSTDNINYLPLATVVAYSGTGNARYEFSHENGLIPYQVIYYRIKAVNNNGAIKYSNTTILKSSSREKTDVVIFPNPTKGRLFLSGKKTADEIATFVILDATGQLIKQSMLNIPAGENVVSLYDMSKYPDGIYLVKLITQKEILTQRIILKK
jgi:hypothetical protein